MDALLEKYITKCFPEDEWFQKIVHQEFFKPKNFEKQSIVDTLAFMVIKSIMHKKLITDETDINSQYIYKLIFRESAGFLDGYSERAPEYKPTVSYVRRRVGPLESERMFGFRPRGTEPVGESTEGETTPDELPSESDEDESFHQYLRDGDIVFNLLNQEIPRFYDGEIGIVLTRKNLQISINWHFIAVIPHRDEIEYDSFWAEKFLKMMLPKYPKCVAFDVNKEGPYAELNNNQEMPNYLDSIVAKLPRVVPPEGWEEYISIDRPVYHKYGGGSSSSSRFGYSFNWHAYFESQTVYRAGYGHYLFCLDEDQL